MPETLLTPSSIKMFGRVVTSLSYKDDTELEKRGRNNFLQHQLSCRNEYSFEGTIESRALPEKPNSSVIFIIAPADVAKSKKLGKGMLIWDDDKKLLKDDTFIENVENGVHIGEGGGNSCRLGFRCPRHTPRRLLVKKTKFTAGNLVKLARIYAFSFEGSIYSLPRPSIFIVHGYGMPVDLTGSFGKHFPSIDNVGRTTLDQSGVMAREWEFSAAESYDKPDLRYWEYEKGDFSMRFDTEAGQLEQILLVAALRAGADMADRATGIRSGASLAGASLAGASLSGASLSGASLSGASLSGASLRNGR